jgi:hypothetical protein
MMTNQIPTIVASEAILTQRSDEARTLAHGTQIRQLCETESVVSTASQMPHDPLAPDGQPFQAEYFEPPQIQQTVDTARALVAEGLQSIAEDLVYGRAYHHEEAKAYLAVAAGLKLIAQSGPRPTRGRPVSTGYAANRLFNSAFGPGSGGARPGSGRKPQQES